VLASSYHGEGINYTAWQVSLEVLDPPKLDPTGVYSRVPRQLGFSNAAVLSLPGVIWKQFLILCPSSQIASRAVRTTNPASNEFHSSLHLTRNILYDIRTHVVSVKDSVSFLYWLAVLRPKLATDPRDKVYAALRLARSYWQNDLSSAYDLDFLIIDYNASIQNVYSSLVKSLVTSSKRPNVLLACGERTYSVSQSWTPDLSNTIDCHGFMSIFYDLS
jgi:hypothetical protein